MKKLIIVLMVVAVASFLFVGCLPTTPVTPVTPVTPTVPTVKTDTPIITGISGVSFTSALAQLTNSIAVTGVAPTGSVIKVYVNDVQTGIGYAMESGLFSGVSGTNMVKVLDGAKTLYVTATQFGLAESDKSLEYTFTYDTAAPKIASAVADSSDGFVTVTFNEAVNTVTAATETATGDPDVLFANSALNPLNWSLYLGGGPEETILASKFVPLSTKIIRIDLGAGGLTLGDYYSISCENISDAQGNDMATGTLSSYFGVVEE